MAEVNLIGQTILGYTVDEQLGFGTFGTVYKVSKDNAAGHFIRALKHITIPTAKQYNAVLNSMGGDYSKTDDYFAKVLQDIVNEIKILNSLCEKGAEGIVRYYENDIIETSSPKRYDVYILMEYLTPFSDYLGMEDFTLNDVINLGLDILSALKICHNNGIIHRDIKDDNIFVTQEKKFKLGDFGVSKVLKDKSKAESMKGTPNFIAPEVYLGKEGYTSSVDLYSLGIVLYKLLNFSRNPFLPSFPDAYDTKDEDKAFEERMNGSIPPLPLNGGTELGQVIVKAISKKETRYTNAEGFYNDLLQVKNSLTPEMLNQKINLTIINKKSKDSSAEPQRYEETIGESCNGNSRANAKDKDSTARDRLNKNLFATVGESVIEKSVQKGTKSIPSSEKTKPDNGKEDKPIIDTIINEPIRREVKAVEKKDLAWIIYSLPFVIALIGIIIYSYIVPFIYGNTVSFIDWLFSGPNNIISTIRDPDKVLPHVYTIIFLRIGMYALSAAFIASLFFVGKQLQNKKEPDNFYAIYKGKEAYFYMMKISGAFKEAKSKIRTPDIDNLGYKIKVLEEKLKSESDFGCSNRVVTDCENEIAHLFNSIYNAVGKLNSDDELNEYQNKIENNIIQVQGLLKQRRELKKQ